jgi:hypothetical protein
MDAETVPPAPRVCARHGHARGHDGTCIVCDVPLEPRETEPATVNAAFDAVIDRKMAGFKFIELVVPASDEANSHGGAAPPSQTSTGGAHGQRR